MVIFHSYVKLPEGNELINHSLTIRHKVVPQFGIAKLVPMLVQ